MTVTEQDLERHFGERRRHRTRCQVGAALAKLKAADRKLLQAACGWEKIKPGRIVAFLEQREHECSISAATYHLAKRCSCHD